MAKVDIADWDGIVGKIPKSLLYDVNGFGRETSPHIGVIYGLEPSVNANTIRKMVNSGNGLPDMQAWGEGISILENDAYNLLKMDVYSPALHYLNQLCRSFPHSNEYPDYSPHLGLAYLLGGHGYQYIRLFDMPVRIRVGALVFSDAEGKVTEI